MSKLKYNTIMTEEQVHNFEKYQAQLDSLYLEISSLSKKKQDDGLNPFKLKLINKALEEVNIILGEEYRPFDYFTKFEEEDIPTNSDVALILGQYLSCMEKLRTDNIEQTGINDWRWILDENKGIIPTDSRFIRIRTKRPEKF